MTLGKRKPLMLQHLFGDAARTMEGTTYSIWNFDTHCLKEKDNIQLTMQVRQVKEVQEEKGTGYILQLLQAQPKPC